MSASISRRFTTIDAMVLIGAMSVALLPTQLAWRGAFATFRSSVRDVSRRGLGAVFAWPPPTYPMVSLGVLGRRAALPLIGMPWEGGLPERGDADHWVANRTLGGRASGYVVAEDAYLLLFPILACLSNALLVLRLGRPRPDPGVLWRQPGWWASLAATATIVAGLYGEYYLDVDVSSVVAPAAVLAAWLTLLVSRNWVAERSWLDRLGRGVGICWIAVLPFYWVGFVLPIP